MLTMRLQFCMELHGHDYDFTSAMTCLDCLQELTHLCRLLSETAAQTPP